MHRTEFYTQVMLTDGKGHVLVCWVPTAMSRVGKQVQDEAGIRWKVLERYATWEKAELDAQHREVKAYQEVLR